MSEELPDKIWAWVYNLPYNKSNGTRSWAKFEPTFKPWVITDWPGWKFWKSETKEYNQIVKEYISVEVHETVVTDLHTRISDLELALEDLLEAHESGWPDKSDWAAGDRARVVLKSKNTEAEDFPQDNKEIT